MYVELGAHQLDAMKRMKNGCILWGVVGSGKSRTALSYYLNCETPEKNIYVITTAKKRDSLDWEGEAAKFGIGTKPGASLAGLLHVDSWNNIGKYEKIRGAFFIFDEQRLVGSGSWVKSFLKIVKNNSWILLTATPGDTWLDYIPVFIANGFYKNQTQFKHEHVVYKPFSKYPKVDRYVSVGKLVRLKNSIVVEMPYDNQVAKETIEVRVNYDTDLFHKAVTARWNVFEQRPMRNVTELFLVMRKIVNSDPSRLAAVRLIMKEHPKLIIFYTFDYELEILRTLSDEVTVAEWNGHKHEEIPPPDQRWVYLVQYASGSESWNCIYTNAMVFYSLTYSYRSFVQAKGRIDRMNTPYSELWYYVLISKSFIDQAIRKALASKRNFQEKKYSLQALDIPDNSDILGGMNQETA